MPTNALFRIALITACILLLPLIAMQFTTEVVWTISDFIVAAVLLMGAGFTFELLASKVKNFAHRAAVAIAVAAALLLIWVNLAVGFIGGENNDANLMFIGVLAVAVIGALIAGFEAKGMARAMFATCFAQVLVAVIALFAALGAEAPIWPWDILGGTIFFAALWIASAVLFQRAAHSKPL